MSENPIGPGRVYVRREYVRRDPTKGNRMETRTVTLAIDIPNAGPRSRASLECEVNLYDAERAEGFTVCISGYGAMPNSTAVFYRDLLDAAIRLSERLNADPSAPHGLPSPWEQTVVLTRTFEAKEAPGYRKADLNEWPPTSEAYPDMPYVVRAPVMEDGFLTDFRWTYCETKEKAEAIRRSLLGIVTIRDPAICKGQ